MGKYVRIMSEWIMRNNYVLNNNNNKQKMQFLHSCLVNSSNQFCSLSRSRHCSQPGKSNNLLLNCAMECSRFWTLPAGWGFCFCFSATTALQGNQELIPYLINWEISAEHKTLSCSSLSQTGQVWCPCWLAWASELSFTSFCWTTFSWHSFLQSEPALSPSQLQKIPALSPFTSVSLTIPAACWGKGELA